MTTIEDLFGELDKVSRPLWSRIPIEDPRAAALADRHYSRQSIGAVGFVPPGRRFALWHDGPRGGALWAVCLNLDPVGKLRWRNTIFRNESGTLSSTLIRSATSTTFDVWRIRYGELPAVDLTTEIDIEATARRRSRWNYPGHCYFEAGWEHLWDIEAGHGRSAKSVLRAPREAE